MALPALHGRCSSSQWQLDRLSLRCRDEGGADGGIVVQDCLELLNNLLRTNASNQLLFRCAAFGLSLHGAAASPRPCAQRVRWCRETGHAGALVDLLRTALPAQPARRHGAARQSAGNMLAALETVQLLLAPLPMQAGAPASAPAASVSSRRAARYREAPCVLVHANVMGVRVGAALHAVSCLHEATRRPQCA